MKVFKIIGLAILAFAVIAILLNAPKKTETPAEAPDITQTAAAPEKPAVEILQSDETVNSAANSRIVHVRVKNNSDKLITYLDLKSIYSAKGGQIVGTGIGNTTNIAAGATKVVDVLALSVNGAENYNIEIGNVMYK